MCIFCQKGIKSGQRKAPTVERPVISQPFEQVALDIVGPLPKGKGGARFILTAVCMATHWPEAIALNSITAKSVAEAAIDIFSRMGLPLQILTDRGAQFTTSLSKQLTTVLNIEHLRTTAYHPQSNGVLEILHATLEAMLGKATALGLVWVKQLPFVVFALRQTPNRSTGFSPFELVYGHNVRTPLDILYVGWRNDKARKLDVSSWVEELCSRLEVMREIAVSNALTESVNRKVSYDKSSVDRIFCEGNKVLCRIPGMVSKLQDSWEGPVVVTRKLSAVNYIIEEEERRKRSKVMHVNNLKSFKERELEVCAVGK